LIVTFSESEKEFPMQKPKQEQYDPNNPIYHEYLLDVDLVCERGTENCTLPTVMKTLVGHGNCTAPFRGNKPVANGQVDSLPMFGEIQTDIDEDNFKITNRTREGHVLHSGIVETRLVVVEKDGKEYIGVQREGAGIGQMPVLNETLSSGLWRPLNWLLSWEHKHDPIVGRPETPKDKEIAKANLGAKFPKPASRGKLGEMAANNRFGEDPFSTLKIVREEL